MSVKIIKYGNLSKAISEGNENAIQELVMRVTSAAVTNAPAQTGQLRNSIMGRMYKKDFDFNNGDGKHAPSTIVPIAKKGQGYVGSNLLYAIYNEFGTRKMAAQPFLRPAIAVEANGAKAKNVIKKLQEKSVKEGMRKGPRMVFK